MTKREFVTRMRLAAGVAKQKGANINARAVIAQGALESGWGNSRLTSKHNNLFGIKASGDWKGATVPMPTYEYENGRYVRRTAIWRAYESWNLCIKDYAEFIARRWWFRDALIHADSPKGDGNTRAWLEKLVDHDQAGELKWATGPDYVAKCLRLDAEIERIGKEPVRVDSTVPAVLPLPAEPTPEVREVNIMSSGLLRFLRVVGAYALIAALNYVVQNLAGFGLPFWAVPILGAILNGILKSLRDQYPQSAAAKIL